MRRALYGWVWEVGSGVERDCGAAAEISVAQTLLSVLLHGAVAELRTPRTSSSDSRSHSAEPQHRQECLCHIHSEGTYVGSCVPESITEAYAVTRPAPLSTFTVMRAL